MKIYFSVNLERKHNILTLIDIVQTVKISKNRVKGVQVTNAQSTEYKWGKKTKTDSTKKSIHKTPQKILQCHFNKYESFRFFFF